MGLFDRNDYGRDYRGGGPSLGDRMRGAWNRFEQRLDGAMHHDYDRDLRYGREAGNGRTYRTGGWGGEGARGGYDRGYSPASFAYRGLDDAWSTARNRGAHDTQWDWRAAGGNRYDQDLGPRRGMFGQERGGRHDYDRGFFGGHRHEGYDRDWSARGGYDRGFGRDRMRTDAGDPFGDRQGRTPFRVIRGGFDTGETDRGGWYQSHPLDRPGGGDPAYRPEDFRDRDRSRGRRGPF
jgi:hypothetical protein